MLLLLKQALAKQAILVAKQSKHEQDIFEQEILLTEIVLEMCYTSHAIEAYHGQISEFLG